jgi:hypothetical protein
MAALRDATGRPIRLGGWHIDLTEVQHVSERLQQQTQVASMYADVSLALARRTSLRVFLQHCVDALLAHVPLAWVGIWMREPCRHGFVPQVRACRAPNAHGGEHDLPVGALTVGKIATSRQPLLSQEAQHDPRLQPQEQTWAGREGMSVFVGYPLLVESRAVGVLALFAREPLPEVLLDALGSLALIIAQASERIQAEEGLDYRVIILHAIISSTFSCWRICCTTVSTRFEGSRNRRHWRLYWSQYRRPRLCDVTFGVLMILDNTMSCPYN